MNLEPFAQIITLIAVVVVGSTAGLVYLAYWIGWHPNQAEQNMTDAQEWLIDLLREEVAELTTQRDTAIEVASDRGKQVRKLTDQASDMRDEVAFYALDIAKRDAARERVAAVQRVRDVRRRLRKSP